MGAEKSSELDGSALFRQLHHAQVFEVVAGFGVEQCAHDVVQLLLKVIGIPLGGNGTLSPDSQHLSRVLRRLSLTKARIPFELLTH